MTEARIIVDPKICHGKPVVKGTRIMVANILSLVEGCYDVKKIQEHYPELTDEDVKEAVRYAITSIQQEEIIVR
jgi:uncharacterized protein (DUF433 family)